MEFCQATRGSPVAKSGGQKEERPRLQVNKSQNSGLRPWENETVTHSSEVLLIGGQETPHVICLTSEFSEAVREGLSFPTSNTVLPMSWPQVLNGKTGQKGRWKGEGRVRSTDETWPLVSGLSFPTCKKRTSVPFFSSFLQ